MGHLWVCIPVTILKKNYAVQKLKFLIKDFFSKCGQIHSFLLIWSHLPKKSLMGNFFFCAVLEDPQKESYECSLFVQLLDTYSSKVAAVLQLFPKKDSATGFFMGTLCEISHNSFFRVLLESS